VKIAWLKGGASRKHKRNILDCQIIIGTHALIQEGIELPRLALAVVDEQHRFGVRQRRRFGMGPKRRCRTTS
jgi:ATP-dependent DNA helicase RecG